MSAVSPEAIAKRKAYLSEWYIKNKERLSAEAKVRYEKNRTAILARQKITQRPYLYKKLYGITIERYDEMYAEQGGGCAICGIKENVRDKRRKHFCVDHDHATGKVRALLCMKCNVLLGAFELQEVEILKYLKRHGKDYGSII